MNVHTAITREVAVVQTPRAKQMMGMFDVQPSGKSIETWSVDLSLPESWNVGVIVGPSGSGKTTVSRELFGDRIVSGWDWPDDKCVLDGFPAEMAVKDITGLLSSVGFSSPPAWLRPFRVLSNGQQFRVTLARTLAEMPDLAVVDEFTSVVDRTAARIGSAAVAKAVRRRGQRFVAVTCHYDVLDWLEPDWVYEPHNNRLEVADATRGRVRRFDGEGFYERPRIQLEVYRTTRATWELFKGHHYLDGDIGRSSQCFVGLVEGRPAAFTAVLPFPHPRKPAWREHRTVCLPDFQGVGIGNAMSEYVASLYRAKKAYVSTTSHPAMIRHRAKSPLWKMTRKPGFANLWGSGNCNAMGTGGAKTSRGRITAGFEYIGPPNPDDARMFGLLDGSPDRRRQAGVKLLRPVVRSPRRAVAGRGRGRAEAGV